jgi:hypothetical protein
VALENLVQAWRFLRDVLRLDQTLQQSWPSLRPLPKSDGPTTFWVEFSVAGIAGQYRYELSLGAGGPVHPPIKERLELGSECLFHQETATARPAQSVWVFEPKLLRVPPPGPIALARIPSISEIVIALTALTSGIGC